MAQCSQVVVWFSTHRLPGYLVVVGRLFVGRAGVVQLDIVTRWPAQ